MFPLISRRGEQEILKGDKEKKIKGYAPLKFCSSLINSCSRLLENGVIRGKKIEINKRKKIKNKDKSKFSVNKKKGRTKYMIIDLKIKKVYDRNVNIIKHEFV